MDLERAETFTAEYKDGSSFFDEDLNSSKNNKRPLPSPPPSRMNTITNAIAQLHVLPRRPTNQNGEDDDDGFMDEETVHWRVLAARVLAFFLLFMILLCIGLEAVTRRFLLLAAIICGVLVIVIVCTYVDARNRFCWCCIRDQNNAANAAVLNGNNNNSLQQSLVTAQPSPVVPVAAPARVLYSGNAVRNPISANK